MIATATRARQSTARRPFAAPVRGRTMERLVAMARIAIGGLHHETNSFAPQAAIFERFVEADGWPPLLRGKAMLPGCAGINLAIPGFVDVARAAGHELVPLLWANACPSGPVTEDAFERLAAMLVKDLLAAGSLDGLFLDLHGAMVTKHLDD